MGRAGPKKALLAVVATACVLVPAGAAAATPLRGPDVPARTAPAKPGSAYASKAGLTARQLRHQLAAQLNAAGGTNGVYVADLSRRHHQTLFSSSGGRTLILASNTKLFTTAAVLGEFGANRTFATRLFARGHRSGASNGRLEGSLALVGNGDPALAAGSFAQAHNLPLTRIRPLAAAVAKAGIRRVDGNIKADPTILDLQLMPHQTGITPENDLGSLSGLEYDSGWLNGSPASSPATLAGNALVQALHAEGVKVTGKVLVGPAPAKLRATTPLASVESPDVESLITEVNTPSDATWAEMLTKRLAAAHDLPGTTAHGSALIKRFTKKVGSHVSLENGSGLSRIDRSRPRDVVALLRAENRPATAANFRSSLALACGSGTVANRMCGTAAAGNCRTKTGTLRDVSALSGYCDAGGRRLAFSILMNDVTNFDDAHHRQDRMAALIARYRP